MSDPLDRARIDELLDGVLDVKLSCDPAKFQRGIGRLRLSVMFCGPWERLESWLLGLDRPGLELRRLIRDGSVRERLAGWANRRDTAWQDRHLAAGRDPRRLWRRRDVEGWGES